MRTELVWSQKVDNASYTSGVCTTKDSDKIFAAAGSKVQVIDSEGSLVRVIDTPHSEISAIVAHPSEQKIVTVGLDNEVIFMDTSGTALFKYGHNTEVQCAAFSPDGEHFLTGADGDVGVYSNGAQRVNKIRTDALVRAVAWSTTSKWFVIAIDPGCLIFMDLDGKEFNRCETGAPIWAMRVVERKELESEEDGDEPADTGESVIKNEVGVYNATTDQREARDQDFKKKTNPAAEQFIRDNKVDEERLLMVSWDQKYRVINPGSLMHSGVLVEQKRAFSGRRKKLQDQNNPFLLAESRLPFIPLCFEFIEQNYLMVAGVGGRIIIIAANSGANLFDLYQVDEMDEFLIQAPRSKLNSGQRSAVVDEEQYKEAIERAEEARNEHTLSYFGLNSTWIYSICLLRPNFIVFGLQDGLTLCIRYTEQEIDCVYKGYYAVREGLTKVLVRNMTTGSSAELNLNNYVSKISLYSSKLLVLSSNKLDVYELQDESMQKREVDSVLNDQYLENKKSRLVLEFVKQHQINFRCQFVAVSAEHFLLAGRDYVCALNFEGENTTSWKFKDTFINCCKVVGGVSGQENIIVGTEDGRILILKIGNRFAIEAVRHMLPVHQVDINASRNLISLIDSVGKLYVYDYLSGSQLSGETVVGRDDEEGHAAEQANFSLANVQSAAFDLVLPNMLAVASKNKIHIVIDGQIVYTHTVNFDEAKILIQDGGKNYNVNEHKTVQSFGLHCVDDIDIPLSPNVTFHVKKVFEYLANEINDPEFFREELDMALQAAALGVPNEYYIDIAVCSLFANQIDFAREALARIGNVRALKLLAEIEAQAGEITFQYIALALILSNNYSDAAMMYAANGDINIAIELLYFTREDGLIKIGPYTSLIGSITQKLINNLLTLYSRKNNVGLGELHPLPNLSLYFKLGSSEEDMQAFREELLKNQLNQNNNGTAKYLEYLEIYDQQPIEQNSAIRISSQQYSYQNDFRIMLRRELQALTPQQAAKVDILQKHAAYLEQIQDWEAAASSYMDAGDCEKAVKVLILNKQVQTLLRLIRVLPTVTERKITNNFEDEDFNWENTSKEDELDQEQLINALKHALAFFEQIGDFENALFVAQRLGDKYALLRLFVQQNMWEHVEDLGKIYPEMLPAIHEARAAAYLREGNFMAALERLRMAGNEEKEIAMIRALIDASVTECKFDMSRELICQLGNELVNQAKKMALDEHQSFYLMLKALRSKIMIYSAYIHLQAYTFKTLGSPDPGNFDLMDLNKFIQQGDNPFLATVTSFLANFSLLSGEIATADVSFLEQYEELDGSASNQDVREVTDFIQSSTKPELGELSQLRLEDQCGHSLPAGVPEQLVWLVLSHVAGSSTRARYAADGQLGRLRLPRRLENIARERMLRSKRERIQQAENVGGGNGADFCCRCGEPLDVGTQTQVLSQRDVRTALCLPMCAPALSDICRKCGAVEIRSALSLRILPLVMVEPDADGSAEELIERVSAVRISDARGQLVKADDEYESRAIGEAVREAPLVDDGRGVVLSAEVLALVGPTRSFVLDDHYADPTLLKALSIDGVVKRVFVKTDDAQAVHYCHGCCFFFDASELEEAFVMAGRCPVCGTADLLV